MDWLQAPNLHQEVVEIITTLKLTYIDPKRVFLFRSFGSRSKAQARIWGFPRIWQKALKITPFYCLEVLAEKFDKLNSQEKKKTLIHELLHIPKNFSGALLPHQRRGARIGHQKVEELYQKLLKNVDSAR